MGDPSAVGKVAMNNSYTIGNMEQDPLVNDDKTVLVVLEEGVSEAMEVLARCEEINMKFMEPMDDDDMNRLL
ncbi:MAG TPA: hypothetical protein PL188_08500 [Candidatus Cloacimonadota bacterium]|nr:hypothetical protein [Candidatus Cloacimonadota bacterium]